MPIVLLTWGLVVECSVASATSYLAMLQCQVCYSIKLLMLKPFQLIVKPWMIIRLQCSVEANHEAICMLYGELAIYWWVRLPVYVTVISDMQAKSKAVYNYMHALIVRGWCNLGRLCYSSTSLMM